MQRLVCSMMTFWKIINFSLLVYSNSGHASDDTGAYINSENKNIHIRQDNCFVKNVDSNGEDIDIKIGTSADPISDVEACQKLCQQSDECMYFLYGKNFEHNGKTFDVCWLKSTKTTLTPYNGLVFGPKRCSDCCQDLEVSASNAKLNSMIAGQYEYVQQYKGAPAYRRTTSPAMYLFWEDNRWVIWKILGQNFYCNPWWAFWNCRDVFGWIRYDESYKCPENVNSRWRSVYTQNIDAGIRVRCKKDSTPTTTTTTSNPSPGFPCGRKPHRIVGGTETGPYSLPWQVGLVRKNSSNKKPFCGGTLISNRHILTAAHCTRSISSFDVVVGEHDTTDSSDGTVHKVSRVVEHPSYTRSPPTYDFAIATLGTPISFSTRANAACLPTSSWGEDFLAGKTMKVSGWGAISQGGGTPTVLHSVEVPGVTNSQCNNLYEGRITNQMLCAGNVDNGGIDSCQGDSGGPLTYSDNGGPTTVVGVVSWGIGCAQRRRPGVYSRVTSVLGWIKNNMN